MNQDLANSVYHEWEKSFNVRELYEYYEGRQVVGSSDAVFNLIKATLERKISSLKVPKPKFTLSPEPGATAYNLETAVKNTNLKTDLLNAIIRKPRAGYNKAMEMALRDSFFGFGIVEVNYSQGLNNPKSAASILATGSGNIGTEEVKASKVAVDPLDAVFFKRIKHWRFRVADDSAESLDTQEWVGYYDYFQPEILKSRFKLPDSLVAKVPESTADILDVRGPSRKYLKGIKVWKVWNNAAKKFEIHLDGVSGEPIHSEAFVRLPLVDIRWTARARGFYPVPPVYDWINPQNTVNDSRAKMHAIRNASIPRYGVLPNSIDPLELDKFRNASGPEVVQFLREKAIEPIPPPQIPSVIKETFIMGMDEFNTIAGTSAEQRGQVDRQTATAAKITAESGKEVELDAQETVNTVHESVGRLTVELAVENMPVPVQLQISGIPAEELLGDAAAPREVQGVIPASLNDGIGFEISLTPIQTTPMQMEADKNAFLTFMQVVQSNPMISMSPLLLRETAHKLGYRNERVIQQFQQIAILSMMAQQAGAGAGAGAGDNTNNVAKRQIAQQTPNTQEQIRNQLNNQVGGN